MTEVDIKDWLTQKIKKESKEDELVVKQQIKKSKRRRKDDGQDKKVGTKKTGRAQYLERTGFYPNRTCYTSSQTVCNIVCICGHIVWSICYLQQMAIKMLDTR